MMAASHRLSRDAYAGIFLGRIKMWNDPTCRQEATPPPGKSNKPEPVADDEEPPF